MIEFGIITCPIHGEFEQRLCDHINCKAGCPKCNSSKGEIAIRHYLASRDINFEEQKTFSGCKDKIRLRFDFYLPDYNLCIEFDGQQHFKPNYPRNNKELALLNLQSLQRRDNIKTQYCTDNNIKLLRVSYIKLKNIDYILTKYLQTNPVWIHHN